VATAVLVALLHRATGAPRGVVATHYHELVGLTEREPRLRPYRMDVLEREHDVVFLHTIVEGAADRSYGVHVARLAGLPRDVTDHAARILVDLEAAAPSASPVSGAGRNGNASRLQVSAQRAEAQADAALTNLARELAEIDVLNLSPLAAQKALFDIQERAAEALKTTRAVAATRP
jgi:DNA mismatch repair protein MutS